MIAAHKDIVENYVASYNNFDVDGMLQDLRDGIVFENIAHGEVGLRTEGLEQFKKQGESAKQYFTARKQTITSWTFKGSLVSVDIDYTALLAIDLPNGLKAGDRLELKARPEFELENGRIKTIRDIS